MPDVVFLTGVVRDGDTLLTDYCAADVATAVAEFDERALIGAAADVR